MKPEKWIGSKYYGFIIKKEHVKCCSYLLSIYTILDQPGYLSAFKGYKWYKYKQSAIRYIKNNF